MSKISSYDERRFKLYIFAQAFVIIKIYNIKLIIKYFFNYDI